MNAERLPRSECATRTQLQTITSPNSPFPLSSGEVLPEVTLAFETWGRLNSDRSNTILVFHALSGSQHAAGWNVSVPEAEDLWSEECKLGWWDGFIGPGKAIDTDRFFVICANYLGGCYGTTGPRSINPETGERYQGDFPKIGSIDILKSQISLLERLGIESLYAVAGGSLGGVLGLQLACTVPDRVTNVISLCSGFRVTPHQQILNLEQRLAIESDPEFRGGFYKSQPKTGLALARMIGHKTFVDIDELPNRAREESARIGFSPIESYMLHQGRKFVGRFDANSYLRLIEMWQNLDLCRDAGVDSVNGLFSRMKKQRHLIFSVSSDGCFAPKEQSDMHDLLRSAGVSSRLVQVDSKKGHDAFLVEPWLFEEMGGFLEG